MDQTIGIDSQIESIIRHDPEVDRRDIFVERTSGGLQFAKRPQLHALLNGLAEGDVIYAYRIDRVGRSTLDLLSIVEKIREAGARFISISDGIDTASGVVSDEFITVLSCIASYERSLISERTRSALQALKDRGVSLGRPKKITPSVVRQIQALHREGASSIREVCENLNISRSSYYNALR